MQICNECSYKDKIDCMICKNCGYCIDEYGNGKCVSGDNTGPYFGMCNSWNNNDNMLIDDIPIKSYYTFQGSQYRRYYGNNQGRRVRHHVY